MFVAVPLATSNTLYFAVMSLLATATLTLASASGAAKSSPSLPWPAHPTWSPTWNMSMSTIMMPCNTTGWFDPALAAQYGIADFDWSNVRESEWTKSKPMDDGARLVQQAAMVKAINPQTHVWVYRNLVKALSWYKDVGEKLADPAYSGWFLRFRAGGAVDLGNNTWHSPQCTAGICSPLFHSQDQTPRQQECNGTCDCGRVPCGEYLWDHRNESLREWLINEHVMGAVNGLGNENVSGFYFDDEWARSGHGWAELDLVGKPLPFNASDCGTGPSEIEKHCLLDMGVSAEDVKDITLAWRNTTAAAMRAVHAKGGWVWQMFTENNIEDNRTAGGPLGDRSECIHAYTEACTTTSKQQTHITTFKLSLADRHSPGSLLDPEGDVAKFLLLRGPYAYLGTSWVGCVGEDQERHSNETYVRPTAYDVDYGVPLGICKEKAGQRGVFVREWSKATVQHDCNTGKSSLQMKHT